MSPGRPRRPPRRERRGGAPALPRRIRSATDACCSAGAGGRPWPVVPAARPNLLRHRGGRERQPFQVIERRGELDVVLLRVLVLGGCILRLDGLGVALRRRLGDERCGGTLAGGWAGDDLVGRFGIALRARCVVFAGEMVLEIRLAKDDARL